MFLEGYKLSLNKFEIFNAVIELGSLTRAGESLGLTQSAVSHAISSLENECGFSLLSRGRTGISLTSNGERMLKYMQEMLRWNEQMKQEIAQINGFEVGTVRIGTFTSVSTLWLPGIIEEFSTEHPSIEVRLQEGNYREIEYWIASGVIDFGFVSLPVSESLEIIPLHQDRMLCILPDNHPLHNVNGIEYRQIENESFIMPKSGCDNDVRRIFQRNHVKPKIKFELEDDYAIIEMVRKGLGISILPEMLLSNLRNEVCAVSFHDTPSRTLGIAVHSIKSLSPAAKKFIACTKSWLNHQVYSTNGSQWFKGDLMSYETK